MRRTSDRAEPDRGRRAFLRGRREALPPPLRPPWACEAFAGSCTACGRCLEACPENILIAGEGGLPEVDFQRGECTFCAACAEACPEPAFDREQALPWRQTATIAGGCLTEQNIVCQSCGDACPEAAIRFAPRLHGVARPQVDALACSGCGACVSACPSAVVSVVWAVAKSHG